MINSGGIIMLLVYLTK